MIRVAGKSWEKFCILLIPLVFFLAAFFTIGDYGINWDEPVHFMRGQAYLNFFLTGETKYPEDIGNRPSQFENRSYSTEYLLISDSGHPPLNGIMASFLNLIFYQKLNLLGDVESYHLFNILAGVLLVWVVTKFAFESFGVFAAFISAISLATYPLFFSETHFNIKDPAEAAFFGLTLFAFYKALKSWSWRWLIVSAIGFGLGLGTKFNILFLPLIAVPYLIYKVFFLDKFKIQLTKSFLLAIFFYPLIVLIIFIGSWPYLWSDPVNNFFKILDYYKVIGTGFNYQIANFYLRYGFNSYPIRWIIYTTPPYILFLSFIGIVAAILNYKKAGGVAILWLLWLFVPIFRVTVPNSSIYGGVRQIMEYIPALALITGLGANSIREIIIRKIPGVNKTLLTTMFLIGFFQILLVLIKIHPNENVYFNQIIGGLSGAKEKNIPSWGNSYGNAYLQGIKWMNAISEEKSRLALVQGTGQNIVRTQLRNDINFNNTHWSGINRDGEYLMELTYQGSELAYPYVWEYLNKFLDPVFEAKVDGVAILKLWKNDLQHTKTEYKKKETKYSGDIKVVVRKNNLDIKLNTEEKITRLVLNYQIEKDCKIPKGVIEAAGADGVFKQEPEPFPIEQVTEKQRQANTIYFYFPGRQAKFLRLVDLNENSCLFINPDVSVFVLEK